MTVSKTHQRTLKGEKKWSYIIISFITTAPLPSFLNSWSFSLDNYQLKIWTEFYFRRRLQKLFHLMRLMLELGFLWGVKNNLRLFLMGKCNFVGFSGVWSNIAQLVLALVITDSKVCWWLLLCTSVKYQNVMHWGYNFNF